MPRKKARSSSSPWPSLPSDVAGEVLLRLPSYADRLCFGAVCRSWRAASAGHPPRLPSIVFIDGTFGGGFPEGERPFRLPRAAGHHGSSGAWLLFRRHDGGYSLLDPFSMAAMPPLPSLLSSSAAAAAACDAHNKPFAREREREEYDVVGLGRRDRLEVGAAEPDPRTLTVRRLVVCSAGLVAAVVGGEGQRLGKFAVCRPGAASWSVCVQDQWRRIKDMVMYQGKLYAVDHNEDLLAVIVVDDDGGAPPAVTRIRRAIRGAAPSFDPRRRLALHYLVDAGGELLMVRREVGSGRLQAVEERFTVFKAEFESKRWVEVSTLGDDGVALFLGKWGSRAVRAPEEHRKEWTDHIFFLDDGASDGFWSPPLYALSTYDMRRQTTYRLLPVMSRHGADLFPATWIFPQQGTRVDAR
ncbi:hypothetical protein QOZ80_2AG0102190 [Eleusine coracana subsp. coracana]|nr:hypothetical protein QOZ80_2AG0102190 [Eleusine coracana subsp. coracana]